MFFFFEVGERDFMGARKRERAEGETNECTIPTKQRKKVIRDAREGDKNYVQLCSLELYRWLSQIDSLMK